MSGNRNALRAVAELGVAGLAAIRALQMLCVGEDQAPGNDRVEIRVAVDALGHVGRAVGIDLDRWALGPLRDHRSVGVRQRVDLDVLLEVTGVAVLASRVTHHAVVGAGLLGLLGVRLASELLDRLMVLWHQIERRRVALGALRASELALRAVLHAVTRVADLHGDRLGESVLVRHARVAAVAADHEVAPVVEHEARLLDRGQVEVTRGALLRVDRSRRVDGRRGGRIELRGSRSGAHGHKQEGGCENDRSHPPEPHARIVGVPLHDVVELLFINSRRSCPGHWR